MMEIKVTVVVPVYNTEKYLEQCVLSIMEQTYSAIEILLVDDGSTDGSPQLCDDIAKRDERIKVIHKENGGAATARNLGIDEAKGEYVMFVDSDDWIDKDTVGSLVGRADENQLDVIRFNYVREFENRKLVKKNTFLEEKVYTDDECKTVCRQILGLTGDELAHPENMNFLASCGFNMYRKQLLVESGARFVPIQEIGSFVDGLFNFQVFMHVKRFEFINKPYYHYRKTNENAATARYRKNYIERQLVLFDKLNEEIQGNGAVDFFAEAYNNRITFSTMEIAFNAMRNRTSFFDRYAEIKKVLTHDTFKSAYRRFSLKPLGAKWKVYYFFIKHSMTAFTYAMTSVILKLKNRGAS